MTWPDVTVVVVTYHRPQEIRQTLLALREHLHYSHYDAQLFWHLADDGSPHGYLTSIENEFPFIDSVSITNRRGWGANVNAALGQVKTDFIFLNEDDYVLTTDIDLTQGVRLMQLCPQVGLVRYDGICGHVGQSLRLCEALPHGQLDYLVIEPGLTQGHFTYSHRPHLKHRRFHEFYGLYAEGLPLADTEVEFGKRVGHMPEGPQIAILSDGIPRAFEHIGESRQGSVEDVHTEGR